MAQLVALDLIVSPLSGAIISIEGIQLYYTSRGRNAWNWTWATHYFARAMNPTLGEAKQRAEALRAQGSVFYITVMPAVLLNTTNGPLVVAQINTLNPFADYLLRPVIQELRFGQSIKLPVVLRRGAKAQRLADSLVHDSSYWKIKQPYKDSVFLLRVETDSGAAVFERLSNLVGSSWKSRSVGANTPLRWDEEISEEKCSSAAVGKLVATAKRLKPLVLEK